ncbi:DUF2059 domain-containing protein [Bacteriovorax sp. Seq25_V]|uniref:DUF2059 domain-containing protein n=1 Tax=Bacteriovorax sp. Seq25_V TaxID=1201288 RepID=UPI0012FA834B|nr:DUF2059 domain-containing protein [Bacteriovorax sp. Seq25_V]
MKKIFIVLSLIIQISGAAQVGEKSPARPSKEKVEYFLEISGLDGLSEKVSEYLYLLELKKNKNLLKSKVEVKKVIDRYYSKKQVMELLVENYSTKFSEKEINKLIAIFETNVMKKMMASQGTSIKEVLNLIKSKENTEFKAELGRLAK